MKQSIYRKNIKIGRIKINYFTYGHGEPLVIIHGGGEGAKSWFKNIEELSKHYRVYIPDLPGFGDSQSIDNRFSLAEYVSFVEEFTNTLDLGPFYLVGHSIGGGIALHYAFRRPERISALILVNSFCLGKDIALWVRILSASALCRSFGQAAVAILRAIKWLAHQFWAPFRFAGAVSKIKMDMGRTMTNLNGQSNVLQDQLPELTMPTLVVWGAKDIIVPARHAYEAAMSIPDCQLHVFEDCGHSAYKQRIPEFSQVVIKFLRWSLQPR
jgi:pimeloyl-ACP methyl ester carboxylesterase